MIIDGKRISQEIIESLEAERNTLPPVLRLGFVLAEGNEASASFVRMKERLANKLQVVVLREEVHETEQAIYAVERLVGRTDGVIVQLPLPAHVDTDAVLRAIPPSHDIDAENPGTHSRFVRAPVAEAISEILVRINFSAANKKAVVIGAGRLVGTPAAALFKELGADVSVITHTKGSLNELQDADIVVLGAGEPGLVKPEMLKEGVVLIDAGTSESAGKLAGDADPRCAEVASVFTPVPGGIGPIAVAMLFKNLFALVRLSKVS
ncbi:MAG: bifunctional 5,10-methylenetetrahydrofolate dehydrogenase/5,10-methenyltetrahydrofolate cyclohydrolase [Minisyncoccia bacterium]|jgi:methylenetetrahydrofolate dehydrogenase (NADP+)/methenyltetrahydrofolate cyclohydrolase